MFEYQATAIGIVDGDTFDVETILEEVTVDYGFRIREYRKKFFEQRVRLYGIDTPERGDPGFTEATEALRFLVMGFETIPLTIVTSKPHDKYGRWLATVSTPQCPDVAQSLIDRGFGVPYFGGKK